MLARCNNSKKGFTLIEIMVSVSIFSMVVLVVIGSILSIFNESKKSQSMQIVMDTLNSNIESMTRIIRFGTNYHCDVNSGDFTLPQDCGTAGASIPGANSIAVLFEGNINIFKVDPVTGRIQQSTDGGITYYNISGSNITIDRLVFYVSGSENYSSGDTRQPFVTIVIEGHTGAKFETQYSFNMQTSVSQRMFDSQ